MRPVRLCKLCDNYFTAELFPWHLLSYREVRLKDWPGGIPVVLEVIRDSLREAIEDATGHPEIEEALRERIAGIEARLENEAARSEE